MISFSGRRAYTAVYAIIFAACLLAPFLLPAYPLFVLSLAIVNVVTVLGLNLVMGHAGQISLGQAGFAAIGAYTTALLTVNFGMSFWPALAAGAVLAAACGYLLGLPTLRLGPLYVSMVTFGFGLIVVVIVQNWYDLANGPNGMVVPPPAIFGHDLSPAEFHIPIVIITAALFVLARNIVDSKHGRAFLAIRETELAARGMGINLAHYKTVAFAIGAFYAGLSGALFAGLAQFVNPDSFVFQNSITYVTMGILGGIDTLVGAAIGGALLTIMPEILRGTAEYKDFLTGLLLLLLLIFLPNGLVGLLRSRLAKRRQIETAKLDPNAIVSYRFQPPTLVPRQTAQRVSLLDVKSLSISFGGVRALQDVSFTLGSEEILAVIGPNGAGKTTLFNIISGLYRPNAGQILYEDSDITATPAHSRARLGIARTFQNLELFGEMTAFDNVLIGAHTRMRCGLLQSALRSKAERMEEQRFREVASDLLRFVGLGAYADQRAKNLPFGLQRMLEIARALALAPKVLLLDEPASGLNASEIDFQIEVIRKVRKEFGLSVLLIGHTMRLVMSLSDRILVLDHGQPLACGLPAQIRCNPRVIEAYLGAEDA